MSEQIWIEDVANGYTIHVLKADAPRRRAQATFSSFLLGYGDGSSDEPQKEPEENRFVFRTIEDALVFIAMYYQAKNGAKAEFVASESESSYAVTPEDSARHQELARRYIDAMKRGKK